MGDEIYTFIYFVFGTLMGLGLLNLQMMLLR